MAAGDARKASIAAQAPTRAQIRQSHADVGAALASIPPGQGGAQPHETIQHAVGRMLGQGYTRQQVFGQLTKHWGYDPNAAASLLDGPNPENLGHTGVTSYLQHGQYTPSRNVIDDQPVEDLIHTGLTRMTLNVLGVLHGKAGAPWDWEKGQDLTDLTRHVSVKNGQLQVSGGPQVQKQIMGLFALQGTGNVAQKTAQDLLGIPIGAADAVMNPRAALHGMEQYYSRSPLENLRQDPFGFGLNYVLPAVSLGGSVLGRAAAVGDTLSAIRNPEALSLADTARLLHKGALQEHLANGVAPKVGGARAAGLVARAALRSPVARERTFTVGDQQFTAPASRNYAVNMFHRAVTDRLIRHALDNGLDVLGVRGKIGRHIRANLRVQKAVRNAVLSHLGSATKGLSAAQEHAAFVLAKGHTAESYAKFAQAQLEKAQASGDEKAAQFYENQLHLTKIAGQYLKPGEEHPRVLGAADAMRRAIEHRQAFYGYTDSQINHSIGSHWYGIHTRAEGLPDLHAELEHIEEQHGAPLESTRHFLDQRIAELERYKSQSGEAHAAEIDSALTRLRSLPDDVAYVRHEIDALDQRIAGLGPEHYRGRMTAHPDQLLGTHHELLMDRSRLEDHLNTLLAHQRHRNIHQMFEEKGAELRGGSLAPEGTTQAVLSDNRVPGRVAAHLDDSQVASLEQHYGVQGKWTPEQARAFGEDMAKAARGEPVAAPVQSAYNASVVAPPEAFYLPFEPETKASRGSAGDISSRASQFGLGLPAREATHAFTGRILDEGGFRTKASAVAKSSFTKASHWRGMQDLHEMLWSLSKETPEEAGRGRFGDGPIPIRDIRQVPASMKEELYGVHPGEILEGEAPDEIAKKLVEGWTAEPDHGEHVRYINPDFVRPLQPQTMGAPLRFINNINNAFRFGRFLNPGYAKWLPQNLVLNLTQQGPFLFRNAAKMMTELQKLDPVVYKQIADSVTHGATRAFETTGVSGKINKVQHNVASLWAHINDHIPRMLSFLHEAQRKGFRTAADWEALMTDPRLEAERQGIIQRANKEPIDYGAMTPRERVYLKSLFAYWPWIRAASLWALRFPVEHPYQAALAMQMGQQGAQHVNDFWAKQGGVPPPYMEGYYPAKGGPIDTSAVNPASQLGQDLQAYAGLTPSHPEDAGALFGMLSPVGKPLVETITGRDQYGKVSKAGVLSDALNRMAMTFEPFSIYKTATATQTGSTPKGGKAAVEKYLGDPQLSGYDYKKAATQALKDISGVGRTIFKEKAFLAELPPEQQAQFMPQARLAIRLAQIGGKTKSNPASDTNRERMIAWAAANNVSAQNLNGMLVYFKMRPASQGDLLAERQKINAISVP